MTGLKEAKAAVDDAVKNKLPILTARALTETAKGLKAEVEKKLPQVFDRPTRWTLNSVMMMSASYKDANPSAYVWFKDISEKGTPAAEYLLAEIFGGGRRLKRYEGQASCRMGIIPCLQLSGSPPLNLPPHPLTNKASNKTWTT